MRSHRDNKDSRPLICPLRCRAFQHACVVAAAVLVALSTILGCQDDLRRANAADEQRPALQEGNGAAAGRMYWEVYGDRPTPDELAFLRKIAVQRSRSRSELWEPVWGSMLGVAGDVGLDTPDGQTVITFPKAVVCSQMRFGVAWVSIVGNDNRFFLLRDDGTWVSKIPCVGKVHYDNMDNGLLIFGRMSDGKERYGALDATGRVIIPAKYGLLGELGGGYLAASGDGRGDLLDRFGRVRGHFNEIAGGYFGDGLLGIEWKEGEGFGFVDAELRQVIKPRFSWASKFSCGRAAAILRSGERAGYVNRAGEFVIAQTYLAALDFVEGYGPVKDDGGWFLIDDQGNRATRTYTEQEFFERCSSSLEGRPNELVTLGGLAPHRNWAPLVEASAAKADKGQEREGVGSP